MKLGVVVLAHRLPGQLAGMLAALRHPGVRLYLHVDAGVDLAPFRSALEEERLTDVVLLRRHRSRWGGIEVVDAELEGLAQAVADGCDPVVLLSGQDVPLWPVERILAFFAETPGRTYVDGFPLPDPRWAYDGRLRTDFYTYTLRGRRETCIPAGEEVHLSFKGQVLNTALRAWGIFKPPRRFPSCARPHGGSQWWNLSREAAEFVLSFVEENPGYRRYHRHTLLADEIFFHSILLGTSFADHNEVVNDALRFMIWDEGAWHPRVLTLADVGPAMASGKPFARKVDEEAATGVMAALRTARDERGGTA